MMIKKLTIILLIFFLPFIPSFALGADTHAAESCSRDHVAAAIALASAGDTVTIPAGTCTWTSGVIITSGITLIGAGVSSTVITAGVKSAAVQIDTNATGKTFTRASGDFTAEGFVSGMVFRIFNSSNSTMNGTSYTIDTVTATIVTATVSTGMADTTGSGDEYLQSYFTPFIVSGCTATNKCDISNFTINGSCNTHVSGQVSIDGTDATPTFRVHAMEFKEMKSRSIQVIDTFGLIDSNLFEHRAHSQALTFSGYATLTNYGWASWQDPLGWGTENYIYVENNLFDFLQDYDNVIDAYRGARYVFRWNDVYMSSPSSHGTDSNKSIHSSEVYNNAHTSPYATHSTYLWKTRGGTHRVFNNTWAGDSYAAGTILLQYYRTSSTMWSSECLGDTGKVMMCSGGTDGPYWYTCREGHDEDCPSGKGTCSYKFCSTAKDTACASDDDCPGEETCSYYLDNTGDTGYPCRDQPGITTNQVISPIYQWGNTNNGSNVTQIYTISPTDDAPYMQENREWFNCSSYADCVSKGMAEFDTYSCPHPFNTDKPYTTYRCLSNVAGRDGYGIRGSVTTIGSGGAAMSIGSGAVMTLQ